MTTKVLSGTYPSGYSLATAEGYTVLSITASGYVQGRGVTIYGSGGADYSLVNHGRIVGAYAFGYNGAYVNGGSVTNGSAHDTTALIQGWRGVQLANDASNLANGAGAVTNFGTIWGDARSGVLIYGYMGEVGGGMITNGSTKDTGALIHGGAQSDGVAFDGPDGALENFGTITGANGAYLIQGGTVTNGSSKDTVAVLGDTTLGRETGTYVGGGVFAGDGAATVSNFGFIGGGDGVYLKGGGVVTNGGAKDETARIVGNPFYLTSGARVTTAAIYLDAGGTVRNFGTVYGLGAEGVILADGGSVTNGAANAHASTIDAQRGSYEGPVYGISVTGGSASVTNFGTISGDYGVDVSVGALRLTNLGAVTGSQAGVYLSTESDGGLITNGSASVGKALIEGAYGLISRADATTVVNFGSIAGTLGAALTFAGSSDELVVEAGCSFVGRVLGGGGTLELANGTGRIAGGLHAALTISGSMPAASFYDFATLVVAAPATFTSRGVITVDAGLVIDDEGALTLGGSDKNSVVNAGLIETTGSGTLNLAGAVTNTGTVLSAGGTLAIAGAIAGGGLAEVNGGTLHLAASTSQAVSFGGHGGVLELGRSQAYVGAVSGFAKSGGKTSLDLDDIAFVSASEATFAGTKTSGVLTVTDGVHTATITLQGDYRSSTFVASSDGHGGVFVTTPPPPPGPLAPPQASRPPVASSIPTHRLVEAAAALGARATGSIQLSVGSAPREEMLAGPRALSA